MPSVSTLRPDTPNSFSSPGLGPSDSMDSLGILDNSVSRGPAISCMDLAHLFPCIPLGWSRIWDGWAPAVLEDLETESTSQIDEPSRQSQEGPCSDNLVCEIDGSDTGQHITGGPQAYRGHQEAAEAQKGGGVQPAKWEIRAPGSASASRSVFLLPFCKGPVTTEGHGS